MANLKLSIKILRIALLLILGIWICYTSLYPQEYFFGKRIVIIACIIWFILWALGFFKNEIQNKLLNFCFGFLFILAVIFISSYQYNRDNSSTILKGYWENKGFNVSRFTIDFKKNRTYIMTHEWFLGSKNYYGTYNMVDSIVTIDKNKIKYIIESNKLLIRIDKNSQVDEIIQIDKTGKEIFESLRFSIIADNRK